MRRPVSLTSRLVLTAVGLVVAVSLLVGATTVLAVRAYLVNQLDEDVTGSLQRAGGDRERGPGEPGEPPSAVPAPPAAGAPLCGGGEVRGQSVGTLTACFSDDESSGDVITEGNRGPADRERLSSEALRAIDALPADGEVREVQVPGFGTYRIAVVEHTDGKLAAGLPTADVSDTVSTLVAWEVGLIGLGGALAAAAGVVVVRRQLRPLTEVAATAHTVASLPLAEGDIELAERVPEHLTDERTEVGQVGAALNALLAHVETSLEARHRSEQQVRQFVADASHELRTPLSTIAGYTELARTRPDEANVRTALAKVEEESDRMTELVEDLLLLARLDAGRPLASEPVDLTRLLVEAVADARVVGPDHTWRLDLPDEPIEVVGDELRLHQAVTNLLSNARRHTPAGTTVTVAATRSGFAVHDDGPGFAADFVPHAFERFARGDQARQRSGGAGLGLSMVEAIVRSHGGTVSLASAPGDTTITVELPRIDSGASGR